MRETSAARSPQLSARLLVYRLCGRPFWLEYRLWRSPGRSRCRRGCIQRANPVRTHMWPAGRTRGLCCVYLDPPRLVLCVGHLRAHLVPLVERLLSEFPALDERTHVPTVQVHLCRLGALHGHLDWHAGPRTRAHAELIRPPRARCLLVAECTRACGQ